MTIEEALRGLPVEVAVRLRDLEPSFPSVGKMMERVDEFPTPTAALLSGFAADPEARKRCLIIMNRYGYRANNEKKWPEIVVGGGVHAAIYCSTRRLLGKPTPLVIEASNRVGGVFAWTKDPAFYLNSRNRSSVTPGVPGTGGELNTVVNGPVQASDLGAAEYQTNTELSFAIVSALATSAASRTLDFVESIRRTSDGYHVLTTLGEWKATQRVIIATGLGESNRVSNEAITFRNFLKTRTSMFFPLREMKRVAVIGGGDSARVAIEFLVGQGPNQGRSVASLDRVERIDWYRSPYRFREEMEELERSRYKGIARFMQCGSDERAYVIRPFPRTTVTDVFRDGTKFGLFYTGRKARRGRGDYDLVIDCTGFKSNVDKLIDGAPVEPVLAPDGDIIGRKVRGQEIYIVGPAAQLSFTDEELERVPVPLTAVSKVALWRMGPKTAAIAGMLS